MVLVAVVAVLDRLPSSLMQHKSYEGGRADVVTEVGIAIKSLILATKDEMHERASDYATYTFEWSHDISAEVSGRPMAYCVSFQAMVCSTRGLLASRSMSSAEV